MRFNTLLLFFVLVSSLSAQPLEIATPIRYLALGDSYTIGESVSYSERWSRQLFDTLSALGYETDTIDFIAQTGWRTDNLSAALAFNKPDSNYTLVSLLIGVNNEFQGRTSDKYKPEFMDLLDRAIAHAGGNKEHVFVVSIPDYMYTPYRNYESNPQAVSDSLDVFNQVAMDYADSVGVAFFNITPISRNGLEDPGLVAYDGLHPSGKQYALWVDLILQSVAQEVQSIREKEIEGLQVFPDSILWTTPLEYRIVNIQGKVLLSGTSDAVNTSQLKAGNYFLNTAEGSARFYKE